jgi:hypothetical protein
LLDSYQSLADLALAEFEDIVTRTAFILSQTETHDQDHLTARAGVDAQRT